MDYLKRLSVFGILWRATLSIRPSLEEITVSISSGNWLKVLRVGRELGKCHKS